MVDESALLATKSSWGGNTLCEADERQILAQVLANELRRHVASISDVTPIPDANAFAKALAEEGYTVTGRLDTIRTFEDAVREITLSRTGFLLSVVRSYL